MQVQQDEKNKDGKSSTQTFPSSFVHYEEQNT